LVNATRDAGQDTTRTFASQLGHQLSVAKSREASKAAPRLPVVGRLANQLEGFGRGTVVIGGRSVPVVGWIIDAGVGKTEGRSDGDAAAHATAQTAAGGLASGGVVTVCAASGLVTAGAGPLVCTLGALGAGYFAGKFGGDAYDRATGGKERKVHREKREEPHPSPGPVRLPPSFWNRVP
jgi:hypothetical protein